MKVLYILLLLCFSCTLTNMSQKEKLSPDNPPGTVHFRRNLYIDQSEVANIHWREFLTYIDQLDSIHEYKKEELLLDTLVWNNIARSEYTTSYHSHPSFNNYPLVGV